MAVIRVNKTSDYTVMTNSHFREKEMSLKAKGLLSLMLSLPDSWDYSISGLVALSKDGKDSVVNALQELETFGYLKRTRATDNQGRFAGYDYDVYEKPDAEKPDTEKPDAEKPDAEKPDTEKPDTEKPDAEKPDAEKPDTEKPDAEKPDAEKPPQLNTNTLSTNTLSTNGLKERTKNSFDAVFRAYTTDEKTLELLGEWLKVRKAKRAALTDRAIQMNVNKLDVLAKSSGMSVNDYLAEVIRRGWAAFYEVKSYGNNNVSIQTSEASFNLDEAEELAMSKYYD